MYIMKTIQRSIWEMRKWVVATSEIFFYGTAETNRNDEAALGLLSGGAEVFWGEDFFRGFGQKGRHFSMLVEL